MPVRFIARGRSTSASGFLFDKDGTLIMLDHWRLVMAERGRRLGRELGLSETELGSLQTLLGGNSDHAAGRAPGLIHLPRPDAEGVTARYLAAQERGEEGALRALVARAFREVDEDFPFDRHLRPAPGAEEVLRAIRRAGGRTAIVTHDTAEATRHHLAALGWTELVDAVIGLDVCAERKPSPEPLLAACGALGLGCRDAVMVGDSTSDLLAGRAADCQLTVGVLTGLGTEDDLAPAADVVVPDLGAVCFL